MIRSYFVLLALFTAAPVFAQSARIVSQGAAYAYAEHREGTELAIDKVVGAPERGSAQVVFFRPANAAGGDAALSEGGRPLAMIAGESYAAVAVAPGTHTFAVDGNALQVRLAAGERRYVRIVDGPVGIQLAPSHAPTFLRTSLGTRLLPQL